MTLAVKICGLRDAATLAAAVAGGAALVGFNFYPGSPSFIDAVNAARLAALVPAGIVKTGLFVDADDATLASVCATVRLDLLQLHGDETPARVAQIRQRTGLPVMKALRLTDPAALATIPAFTAVADRLLFDSRRAGGPSGGPLDWASLHDIRTVKPWLLAGGLTADTLATAVRRSGATAVDVSSGVEAAPGVKSPEKIHAFLAAAARL